MVTPRFGGVGSGASVSRGPSLQLGGMAGTGDKRGELRREHISEQRKRLPDQPGVYMFSDADGRVVYVGKSRSIRERIAASSSRSTLGRLARQIETIDFLVTGTEAEALIAEQQFIKRHRPILNVKLRDDKSYPYIGISLDEEFRVSISPASGIAQWAYFGPYASARRVRETLELLGKLFQYRCDGARLPASWLPACPASTTTSSVAERPASATSTPTSTGATSTR